MREFDVSDAELEAALGLSLADAEAAEEALITEYNLRDAGYDVNAVLEGTIVRVEGEEVLIDIGYKSEGIVPIDEWSDTDEPPVAGQKISVLLEEIEDEFGLILLSKRKADRIREWEKIISTHKEGDIVKGEVLKKIKGGLLVNIGVNVFLPASQVDIRRPQDIDAYRGKTIECLILKIDEDSSLGHRLEPNDVLEAVGRTPIASLDDLEQALEECSARDSVVLHVHRATDTESREQLVVWRRSH